MNETVPSVVAIDIGTNKVSVLIAKVYAPDRIEVIGMGSAVNRGMSKGKIASLDKVITSIKNAVQEAEDRSECRIHSAWISIPSAELKSFYASGQVVVENSEKIITTNEMVRALDLAKASQNAGQDHYLVSAVPLGFDLDDAGEWVQNPLRMSAQSMTAHYQLMTLPITTMQNVDRALKGANIGVEKIVISSLATAEATLLPDEKEYGVCLIDIGAGTTDILVYIEGRLAFAHTLQKGGDHVTRDIASVLQTTTEEAERLKIKYGCVDLNVIKPDHMIQIQGIEGPQTISRIELAEIIIARYDEIFAEIHHQLQQTGAIQGLYHGVVLAGNASKVEGIINFSRRCLGISAHLGNHPPKVICADEQYLTTLQDSSYRTAVGLLIYSQNEEQGEPSASEHTNSSMWVKLKNSWGNLNKKLKKFF